MIDLIVRCHGCGAVIFSGSLEEFAKKDFYDTVHECPFCGRRLSTEPIDVKIRVKTNTRA